MSEHPRSNIVYSACTSFFGSETHFIWLSHYFCQFSWNELLVHNVCHITLAHKFLFVGHLLFFTLLESASKHRSWIGNLFCRFLPKNLVICAYTKVRLFYSNRILVNNLFIIKEEQRKILVLRNYKILFNKKILLMEYYPSFTMFIIEICSSYFVL